MSHDHQNGEAAFGDRVKKYRTAKLSLDSSRLMKILCMAANPMTMIQRLYFIGLVGSLFLFLQPDIMYETARWLKSLVGAVNTF